MFFPQLVHALKAVPLFQVTVVDYKYRYVSRLISADPSVCPGGGGGGYIDGQILHKGT